MPRLRSVDTIEYGFLLAAMLAAGAAQFPGAALAVHRTFDDIVEALGEPAPSPPRESGPARIRSPYSADAPPNGKPALPPPAQVSHPPSCPPGFAALGPMSPREWWRPLLPELDARGLAGRLDVQRQSATERWR